MLHILENFDKKMVNKHYGTKIKEILSDLIGKKEKKQQ